MVPAEELVDGLATVAAVRAWEKPEVSPISVVTEQDDEDAVPCADLTPAQIHVITQPPSPASSIESPVHVLLPAPRSSSPDSVESPTHASLPAPRSPGLTYRDLMFEPFEEDESDCIVSVGGEDCEVMSDIASDMTLSGALEDPQYHSKLSQLMYREGARGMVAEGIFPYLKLHVTEDMVPASLFLRQHRDWDNVPAEAGSMLAGHMHLS